MEPVPRAGGGLATPRQQGHKTVFISTNGDLSFPIVSEEPAQGSGQVLGLWLVLNS